MKSKERRWQKLGRRGHGKTSQSYVLTNSRSPTRWVLQQVWILTKGNLHFCIHGFQPRTPASEHRTLAGHGYLIPGYWWKDMIILHPSTVGGTWLSCTQMLLGRHGYPVPGCWWKDIIILHPSTVGRTWFILYPSTGGGTWLSCTRVLSEGHGYPVPEYCWRDMVICTPVLLERNAILHPNTVGRTWLSCTRVLLEGHSLSCTRELLEGHGYPVSEHCWRGMVILHPGTVGRTWLFCTRALWKRRDDQSPCTPVLWRIKTWWYRQLWGAWTQSFCTREWWEKHNDEP